MQQIIGLNRKAGLREIRVIASNGNQLGVLNINEALRLAEEENLDLVCVQPKANPPVCKIIDYGKFKYEKKKAEKEAKKNQHVIETKEIKFRPKIGDHDFDVKLNKILEIIAEGNRVKVTVTFRGRENMHKDVGLDILQKIVAQTATVASPEENPQSEGKTLFITLSPSSKKKAV